MLRRSIHQKAVHSSIMLTSLRHDGDSSLDASEDSLVLVPFHHRRAENACKRNGSVLGGVEVQELLRHRPIAR